MILSSREYLLRVLLTCKVELVDGLLNTLGEGLDATGVLEADTAELLPNV